MSLEQRSRASFEQCQALSWLELRRERGEIDAAGFKEGFSELLVPRTPDRVADVRERLAIPPGFAPVAPLNEHQRQQELDWVETGLRRTYLDGYAGRHVVDHRFVVLHVCRDLGLIVMSTRQRVLPSARADGLSRRSSRCQSLRTPWCGCGVSTKSWSRWSR